MSQSPKKRTAVVAIGILLVLLVLHGFTGATGQSGEAFGASPGSVIIEKGVAGETYHRSVHLQNRLATTVQVDTQTSGSAGAWTTVDPPSTFTMPTQSDRSLNLLIHIPTDTPDGTYESTLHITAQAEEGPDGDGFQIQHAIAIPLEFHVGTSRIVAVDYLAIDAHDIELGDPPRIQIEIANTGNVRTQAASKILIEHEKNGVRFEATTTTSLDPGERTLVAFHHDDIDLPLGVYRTSAGEAGEPPELVTHFKVVPPGTLGKDLLLRELIHPPRGTAGEPIKIEAPVVNTGEVPIGRATLSGEVHRDGRLVATLESGARSMDVNEEIRLVAHFTPSEPGRYHLTASVAYDGFESPQSESLLEVQATTASLGDMLPWLLLAAFVVAGASWAFWQHNRPRFDR